MSISNNIPPRRIRAQIAVKANVSIDTVYRYYLGKCATRPLMAEAIRQAAAKVLGDADKAGQP